MRLNRISVWMAGVILALSCTTLTFAAEENKQVTFAPDYRETKEFEVPIRDLNSFEFYSSPYLDIGYAYSSGVTNGTVRYISQMTSSKYFYSNYWGKWDGNTTIRCGNGSLYGGPGQECFTSCISMSLSYIGVNKTPKDILDFGSGITIVNSSWGGATYKSLSFTQAFENFVNGNGKYSPPIIHLNNYTYAGHYVLVIGTSGNNVYQVLDPAIDTVWNITINGSNATYTLPNGKTKSDTVTSAHQYYKENASLIKPFLYNIDTKTDSTTYTTDVSVKGWAIYGNGITKVAGIINGKNVEFTQTSRLDVAKIYTGYPTGKEGFTGTVPAAYLKNGANKLELVAYYNSEAFSMGSMDINFENKTGPEISEVEVLGDVEGYTVSCKVTDDIGIEKVQFPTWTKNNGQDDLIKDWQSSQSAAGTLENGVYTYRVNRLEHNQETGVYHTHIYAYDTSGNITKYTLEHYFNDIAPEIKSFEGSLNEEGYSFTCEAFDEDDIKDVKIKVYKFTNGEFQVLEENSMEKLSGEETAESEAYVYNIKAEEEESCIFKAEIYVYDSYGNCAEDSTICCVLDEQIQIGPTTNICGENLTYSITEDKKLVIKGTGAMSDYSESQVPWAAFANSLKAIIIEEGVTDISAKAFRNCVNVKEVILPDTLCTVGDQVFENGFSLEKIVFPASVVNIGEAALNNCISLKHVIVLGETTEIGLSELSADTVMVAYPGSSAEMFALINGLTFKSLGGDLDSDGRATASDALMVLKHAASMEIIKDEIMLMSADVNSDNKVDALDALDILKKAAGII